MKDLEAERSGATLKDGSYVNLRIASIVVNPHYVSSESIIKTRKKWDNWYEYQHLKEEGVVKNKEEYRMLKIENEKKRAA